MTDAPVTGTGAAPAGGAGGAAGGGPGPAQGGMAAGWPRKAADAIDLVVDTIHDKAIRPAMLAARAVVFGLLVAVLSLVVLVLLSVGLVRLLDVYAFGGRVWISYAVLGGLFTLAGLLAWSRRAAPAGRSPEGR
jgi:hypothetical protein